MCKAMCKPTHHELGFVRSATAHKTTKLAEKYIIKTTQIKIIRICNIRIICPYIQLRLSYQSHRYYQST